MRALLDALRGEALRSALLGAALACALSACAPGSMPGSMPGSIGVLARREVTGRVVVVEVPPGGAGARAGLETGDEILAVDGVAVAGMSKEDFQRAVRGPVGSKVTVDVRRDGLRRRIVVERLAIRGIEPPPKP